MFRKLHRNIARHLFGKDPYYQDPFDDPAEKFYGRIYLKFLSETIDSGFHRQRARILDLGCHTGRLSIPLTEAGHEVTGIDTSRFLIKQAEKRAAKSGVPCRFLKGDGFSLLRKFPENHFDVILCTEVLYQIRNYRDRMQEMVKYLRPGGLFATSHRTRFFYIVRAIAEKDFKTAEFIRTHSEGEIWGNYFNWQTPSELKELYKKIGVEPVLLRPIGTFTGNGADGLAKLCAPGTLEASEREALFEIEAAGSEEFAQLGRYLFIVGRKQET